MLANASRRTTRRRKNRRDTRVIRRRTCYARPRGAQRVHEASECTGTNSNGGHPTVACEQATKGVRAREVGEYVAVAKRVVRRTKRKICPPPHGESRCARQPWALVRSARGRVARRRRAALRRRDAPRDAGKGRRAPQGRPNTLKRRHAKTRSRPKGGIRGAPANETERTSTTGANARAANNVKHFNNV